MYPLFNDVYNFALRLTGAVADAEDLVQETFIRAYRSIGSYTIGTNARAWLFRIAKNQFINDYRKRSRAPYQVELEDRTAGTIVDTSVNAVVADCPDLRDPELFVRDLSDEMTDALRSLSPDFRLVFLLIDLFDYSYEEVADDLGWNINTVRTRLRRARGKLAEKLADYALENGVNNIRFND